MIRNENVNIKGFAGMNKMELLSALKRNIKLKIHDFFLTYCNND